MTLTVVLLALIWFFSNLGAACSIYSALTLCSLRRLLAPQDYFCAAALCMYCVICNLLPCTIPDTIAQYCTV